MDIKTGGNDHYHDRRLRYSHVFRPVMEIKDILEAYKNGKIAYEEAEKALRMDYIETVKNHTVFDHGRRIRKDVPEVVYALSKTPDMVADIAERMMPNGFVLISRASDECYRVVSDRIGKDNAKYHHIPKIIEVGKRKDGVASGRIGILTAGSSDIPVAEEAKIMAETMGCTCVTAYDIGVAGLHRILEPMGKFLKDDVDCIVVAAGMEGALPSLVASLSYVPVIGVPTSTGYGYGGKGEAALMSMLQTCSPGLAVVNIDNGIGAGAMAAIISRRRNGRQQ